MVISLKNKKLISIKKKLIVGIISATSLLILISWVFIVGETKHEIKEVYDARLSQSAKILALTMPNIVNTSSTERDALYEQWFKAMQKMANSDDEETSLGHPYEENFIVQFYKGKHLIFKSPNAPKDELMSNNAPGFGELEIENEKWRFFQLNIPNPEYSDLYILLAEKQSIRNEVITEIALSTSLPQLLLIPALFIVTLGLVNKFLKPITELQNGDVQIKVGNTHTIKHVAIIDVTGRVVYNLQGNDSIEVYDLSKLSQAAYIAKITLSNGQVISKKAIKQH